MAAKSQICHRYQNQGKLKIISDTAKLELKAAGERIYCPLKLVRKCPDWQRDESC